MSHFVHYLRRKVVNLKYYSPHHPWFAENQPDDQGFDMPKYHVTRSHSGPATRIVPGDTIWLFAQLSSPWGKLPPALDAKIEVSAVTHQIASNGFQLIRYEAGRNSIWFPLFDATTCIKNLTTLNSRGEVSNLVSSPQQPIGQALQSIRELAVSVDLVRFALDIEVKKFDFVSYRLIDGTQRAFYKVVELINNGVPVFWDRWSLPRRLAERREFLNDTTFTQFILHKVNEAEVVWGIISPKYGEIGSYSHKEMEAAQVQGVLRMVYVNES